MSVDFSNVKVGDRIKLTRENGDESTFTVGYNTPDIADDVKCNAYYGDEWDTMEILEKPLPTRIGAMIHNGRKDRTYFILNSSGEWLNDSGHHVEDPKLRDGWKVVFEGLEYDA